MAMGRAIGKLFALIWCSCAAADASGTRTAQSRVAAAAAEETSVPSTCGMGCQRFTFVDGDATHGAKCLDGSPVGFYHR
jgi:hypothetical protein